MPDLPSRQSGRKPPTQEILRILEAVRAGALRHNDAGRYIIVGQERPERRARQLCVSRGYMEWVSRFARDTGSLRTSGYELTKLGREVLEAQDPHYV